MKKKWWVLLLLLFLWGCQSAQQPIAARASPPAENVSLPPVPMETGTSSPSSACTAQWVCFSSTQKIYRQENCSLGQKEACKFGCVNDSCKPAPHCEVGSRCKGTSARGYQLEDCSWTSVTACEFGCAEAKCLEKPNVTVEKTIASSTPVRTAYPELSQGQSVEVESESVIYPLSIYAIDPDQVKLSLGSWKSNWLQEGESFTFGSAGVMVTVHEIFFQAEEGGKRAVTYTVE